MMIAITELDEVLYNLYMCEQSLNNWDDTSELIVMIEKGEEAAAAAVNTATQNNEQVEAESTSYLSKALTALKKMIQKLVNFVRNTFDRLFMSKDDQAAFALFKEEMAKNPNYGDKAINTKDYIAYQAEYDNLNARADKAEALLASGQDCDLSQLTNDSNKFLQSLGGIALTTVAIRSIENYAYSNRAFAKKINYQLKRDSLLLDKLEEIVGKKQTKKFKKTVNALSKRTFVVKLRYQLNHKMYHSLADSFKGTMNEVKHEARMILNLVKGNGRISSAKDLLMHGHNTRNILTASLANKKSKQGTNKLLGYADTGTNIYNAVMGKDTRSPFKKKMDKAAMTVDNGVNRITGNNKRLGSTNYVNSHNVNHLINTVDYGVSGVRNFLGL